ncbi:hypothetical protein J3R83DRAFT_7962 [Lanmaoa asiatica]|nr:hypothetical protein J3R83DRAFT_7962 [Lanmaoa asiatica]
MADIDRMFRCELAVLAEQPEQSDLWALDPHLTSVFASSATDWDSLDASILSPRPASPHTSEHADTALGLFPAPDRRLGGPTHPADPLHTAQPQPTVHLSDLSLGTTPPVPMPMPFPPAPSVQIPTLSASSSSPPLTDSPTDTYVPTDPSSEDMDSDDFEFTYPSDSEFLPSPVSIDPAALHPHDDTPPVRPSRRTSRAMTKVPVPIPNLTKKSRGRKVPTSNGEPIYAASRDKTKKGVRTYTCNADGCGKCFVRGEHLKRHIRSIHTDEKRG